MAHPYHHALRQRPEMGRQGRVDYLPIHNWFDESKAYLADFRHRALRHHAEGIFLCETIFGVGITTSQGKVVPVRWIGEQHARRGLGADLAAFGLAAALSGLSRGWDSGRSSRRNCKWLGRVG